MLRLLVGALTHPAVVAVAVAVASFASQGAVTAAFTSSSSATFDSACVHTRTGISASTSKARWRKQQRGKQGTPPLQRRRRDISSMVLFGKDESSDHDDDSGGTDNKGEYDDLSFYASLKEAKNKKLGTPIPPSELDAAAADAENEFLKAMKQAKADFEKAKEETGSVDGAVDRVLDGIRREEALEASLGCMDDTGIPEDSTSTDDDAFQ